MATRKGITALALSVLLALSTNAMAGESPQEKWAETVGARICRDRAYALAPKTRLLTIETQVVSGKWRDLQSIVYGVFVMLGVKLDGESFTFTCRALYDSSALKASLVPGSFFSKGTVIFDLDQRGPAWR